jgi:hypothetical protein
LAMVQRRGHRWGILRQVDRHHQPVLTYTIINITSKETLWQLHHHLLDHLSLDRQQ